MFARDILNRSRCVLKNRDFEAELMSLVTIYLLDMWLCDSSMTGAVDSSTCAACVAGTYSTAQGWPAVISAAVLFAVDHWVLEFCCGPSL